MFISAEMEELLQAAKVLKATTSNKLADLITFLVRYKNASSIALAGVTIVTVCAWRYMSRRRPPKLDASAAAASVSASSRSSSSGASSATGASTAVSYRSSRARQRGGGPAQDSASPLIESSLVRQLKGGRKVTCQLLGVVLQESTAEELEKHVVVRPEVVNVLLELARTCDLYLMARVVNDANEEAVLAALDKIGLFSNAGLNRDKVLFCSSEAGRGSFVRQLEPDWHIDTSPELLRQLARYIHHQLYIAPSPGIEPMAANVLQAETLEKYFTSS